MSNENKVKHLEMIQGVITRMAANSFALKGWAITLLVAIIALGDKSEYKSHYLATLIPIVGFWIMDAYYLQQERLYRALYDKVRIKQEKEVDFNMDTSIFRDSGKTGMTGFCSCLFSRTIIAFYLLLALLLLGFVLIGTV